MHLSKPWSHAPITLLCLYTRRISMPTVTILFFHVTLQWTPVTLFSPQFSSWLCASVALPAIPGFLHVTIWSYQLVVYATHQLPMSPTSRQWSPVGSKNETSLSNAVKHLSDWPYKHTNTKTNRHTGTQPHTHTHIHTYTHAPKHTHIQTLLTNKPFVW